MKKFFLATFIIALVSVIYVKESMDSCTSLTDLGLENVEALAQGEGVSAGFCYLIESNSDSRDYKYFCDSATGNDKIYPCPSRTEYG